MRSAMMAIATAGVLTSTASFAQTYSVIWNFAAGSYPWASPRPDPTTGTVYGTTQGPNYGTVYGLKEERQVWKNHTLLAFDDTDGASPSAGVIEGSHGNLYGTTGEGGADGEGTVFELVRNGSSWNETVLHSFFIPNGDGADPNSDLIMDKKTGAIFGTTQVGGTSNCGTVFELTKSRGTWSENVIYSFGANGCYPGTRLREDSQGRLYGGTSNGGTYGRGEIFMLANSGVWKESVLYNFTGGPDGWSPTDLDLNPTTGTLYGTTASGGNLGYGVIFQLTEHHGRGVETILYSFAGGSDGSDPVGLHLDLTSNTLYGTTYSGGSNNAGSVFQLVGSQGSWTYTQLHSFGASGDGANPTARPSVDPNTGYLYGATVGGGAYGSGTAWTIIP